VTPARILAAAAAIAFVLGLAGTFGWTYREQSRTVADLRRERASLRAENHRLSSSVASAQTALTTLGTGLAQARAGTAAARSQAAAAFLDGYAAGALWALGADPYGGEDALDAGSTTGYAGR
jgi:hypothetical protein